jgi:hypothetical protein
VLARRPPARPKQHRPIGVRPPTAFTFDPLEQGRVGLNALTLQPQAHHRRCSSLGCSLTMAGALREQGREAPALLIELQFTVGRPEPLVAIAMAIQPGAALAAQPTAQEAVVEQDLSWHPLTLGGRRRLLARGCRPCPAPMASAPLPLEASPIAFGTDGWRGILGVDITVERLLPVAAASARELEASAPAGLKSREIVVGYDRRFLAPELAEAICSAVRGADLVPVLAEAPIPTPAASWAVVERQALGALVITASHNPPEWLGLKIKGPFGGSVEGDFTKRVEQRLQAGGISVPIQRETLRFDAMGTYLAGLKAKVDTAALSAGLERLGLQVIVDPMHGSAAGGLSRLLEGAAKSDRPWPVDRPWASSLTVMAIALPRWMNTVASAAPSC